MKNRKIYNENLEYKMYLITNEKGIIKDVSLLAFSYFKFNL